MLEAIICFAIAIILANVAGKSLQQKHEDAAYAALKRFVAENNLQKKCEDAAYAALKRLEAEKEKELAEKSRE